MPPRQRGGRQGGTATTPPADVVYCMGDDSTEEGNSNNFEEFVRSTLAKIVNGKKQLEMRLTESFEYNSDSYRKEMTRGVVLLVATFRLLALLAFIRQLKSGCCRVRYIPLDRVLRVLRQPDLPCPLHQELGDSLGP